MRNMAALLSLFFILAAALCAYGASGDITFSPPNAGPVVFSHDFHTKSRGIKCAACHFDRFSAGGVGFKIDKKKLSKREFCGHCHNGLKSFDLQAQQNCARCHRQ